VDGDRLVGLIGRSSEHPAVELCLDELARGQRPQLDIEDRETYFDWIVLNEIGLKLGFDDEAWLLALDDDLRGSGKLLLSQVWFHGDRPDMQPFPFALPFSLLLSDSREEVRRKLGDHEGSRRSYISDMWRLPQCTVTVSYRHEEPGIEWIYCQLPESPWPPSLEDVELPTPEQFARLFGLRWSSVALRDALRQFHLEGRLDQVRKEGVVDLRREHGIELHFAKARQIGGGDGPFADSPAFAAVTYYAARELDSRQWRGTLPFGLDFSDTPADVGRKVAKRPAEHHDVELSGYAVWHGRAWSLEVLYSNLENRPLRVSLMDPGYWPGSPLPPP